MGRTKSAYPKGTFYLKNQPNDKGDAYIYLRYFVINKYAARSTNIAIKASDWEQKTQQVKSTNKSAARINAKLASIREQVDRQIMAYEGRLTKAIIEQMMDGNYVSHKEKIANTDFVEYALNYNEQRYKLGKISYSTYDNGRLNIVAFRNFISNKTGESVLPMAQLNVDIFNEYIAWRLKDRGNTSREGINKTLTPLYKAIKYAADNELLSHKVASTISNNYLETKDRKYNSAVEDKEVHYLTPEQMQQFVDWYLKVKYDRTREIMDMFLFSFYACGLRVSDIITLEWSHIDWEKREISKNLFKGNKAHEIPLTEAAIEILLRWKSYKKNPRFVFDLLYSGFDLNDEAALKNARLSKNRTLQQSLKEIGKKMNLPFNLTMHVARHSFAVMALQRGVTLHMISRLMGHASIITTENIYAEFLPSTINEEVKSKLSFCFTPTIDSSEKN